MHVNHPPPSPSVELARRLINNTKGEDVFIALSAHQRAVAAILTGARRQIGFTADDIDQWADLFVKGVKKQIEKHQRSEDT